MFLVAREAFMTSLVPWWERGILLKSKMPSSFSYDNSWELLRDFRSMLNVYWACINIVSQNTMVKLLSVSYRSEIKYDLKF